MNAAIIYWSKTGNTEKVALAIKETLEANDVEVTYKHTKEAGDLDWFDYDLVCIGFPSYHWAPPKPVDSLLRTKTSAYGKQGLVKPGSPKVPGKNALIFCTYSGPHTGLDEATPATDYAAQHFAHLGFTILGKWHIVGEFHGREELSTTGVLGDIRGRPDEDDLAQVKRDTTELLKRL
jgi:hypothetical protein